MVFSTVKVAECFLVTYSDLVQAAGGLCRAFHELGRRSKTYKIKVSILQFYVLKHRS